MLTSLIHTVKEAISPYYRATLKIKEWLEFNDPRLPLDFRNMGLTSLPPIPLNCQELWCQHNKLTALPDLPNCKFLICDNNKLATLPQLPNCTNLNCSKNSLTTLPELPNCTDLNCYQNNLTSLGELPKCKKLCCDTNKLTMLPNLPECTYLHCEFNSLIYFPYLPKCGIPYTYANEYLYISEKQAEIFNTNEVKYSRVAHRVFTILATNNYNRNALTVQRAYRRHLRKKYRVVVDKLFLTGLSKIICLYAI